MNAGFGNNTKYCEIEYSFSNTQERKLQIKRNCAALYQLSGSICTVLYCILYRTVLHCTVLYCTYCTVLYCTVLYCTVLYCTVLYCTVLYLLYCTVLYCTLLYCTVNEWKTWFILKRILFIRFVHNLKSPNLDAQKFRDETTFNFETSLLLFIFRAECYFFSTHILVIFGFNSFKRTGSV